MSRIRNWSAHLSGLLLCLGMATPAEASWVLSLDTLITGSPATGTAPYLTVTATQLGVNQVQLEFDTTLSAGAFVSNVYMNYDPSLTGKFSAQYVSGAQTKSKPTFSQDGVGFSGTHSNFDALFAFATANNGRLGNDVKSFESSIYTITYSPTGSESLLDSSFNFLSKPDRNFSNSYYLGAHLQGLLGGGSAKYGEINSPYDPPLNNPEPSTIVLLGTGMATVCGRSRLRKRKS